MQARSSTRKGQRRPSATNWGERLSPANLLVGFIIVVFLIGGASRGDVLSLQFLRPLALIMLAVGLVTLRRDDWQRFRWPLGLMFATLVLVGVYLIPVSPSLWQALPGRELIAEIDQLSGVGEVWRPISVDPPATWNALWSLAVPLAALVLAAQVNRDQQRRILATILIIGVISGLLAIIQTLGAPNGPAYFYRVTNFGSAVGLFANRNHQAVFLTTLLPMLAAWLATRDEKDAKRSRVNLAALTIAALVLTPLILVTGSRAGLITLLGAIVLALWVGGGLKFLGLTQEKSGSSENRKRRGSQKSTFWRSAILPIAALLVIVGVVAAALLSGRGTAITRLSEGSYADDARGQMAPILVDLAQQFMPLGSGPGTFVAAYKMFEPDSLLRPQYANHAHNDFLEVAMTMGAPGLILLTVAILVILARLRIIGKRIKGSHFLPIARAGFAVLLLFALGSAVDYPLRVPSIQALAMVALVWLFSPVGPRGTDRV